MTYRDRSVDVFVRRLRIKLHDAAPGWIYIHTHFGIGYRFAPERILAARQPIPPPSREAPAPPTVKATPTRSARGR
jgi:DNA-binding winged helix-turn-helix (wHTH) protein